MTGVQTCALPISEIIRLAQVKYARDRYVGCQFVDQKSYDSDLGFYLMR